jgi:hypothetical protein
VSIKTVEAAFGTRARLLSTLRDVTIVGDDQAIPAAGRPWFQEMLDEPGPAANLNALPSSAARSSTGRPRLMK